LKKAIELARSTGFKTSVGMGAGKLMEGAGPIVDEVSRQLGVNYVRTPKKSPYVIPAQPKKEE